MGVSETTRLLAGWYPDPEGENRRRWWDGREWTTYTAEFQRPAPVYDVPASEAVGGLSGGESSDVEDAPAGLRAAERIGRWLAVARFSLRRAPKTPGVTDAAPAESPTAESPTAGARDRHGRRAQRSSRRPGPRRSPSP